MAVFMSTALGVPLAFGWATHNLLSEEALGLLPGWQRDLIGAEARPFIKTYCVYPDTVDAEALQYMMTNVLTNVNFHVPVSQAENLRLIEHYVPRVLEAFACHDVTNAMRLFGCLAHYLEDSSCPGHFRYSTSRWPPEGLPLHSLEFMKRLMPVPPPEQGGSWHSRVDACAIWGGPLHTAVTGYTPRLLGTNAAEIIFWLGQRHDRVVDGAGTRLVPALYSLCQSNEQAFVREVATAAAEGTRLVADALYSIVCVAADRVDPAEAAQLPSEVNLADLAPATGTEFRQDWCGEPNYQGRVMRNACGSFGWMSEPRDLGTRPLKLKMDNGTVREFAKGWGMTRVTECTFLLQPGLFRTFSVWVGNHPEIGQTGETVFEILLDGRRAAGTDVMRGLEPGCRRLEVELGQARRLTLKTSGQPPTPTIHAVWADPVLRK